ncbi:porin [Massilia sp. W12]|uniref:porin n=1 Tax=Massilia sp. W12 TaxID=3126507 RepID=UPI0030CD0483
MLKRFTLAAFIAASLAPLAAQAGKLGDIDLSGYVLLETWVDRHDLRGKTALPANQPYAFVLHNLELGGEKEIGGGQKVSWRLGHRNRNGNLGNSGATGSREAWLGIEGEYGAVKVGRFLTKAWQVLDYPYGSAAWQAEPLAETGAADWVTVKAIRYTAPRMGGLELEATYDTGNQSNSARAALFEGFARYSSGPLTFDFIAQRKVNAPLQVGVGDFGGSDGGPDVKDGNRQGIWFAGMRWQMGGGFELLAAYKRNYWHADGGAGDLPQWGGRPATSGVDLHNSRILLGLNYQTGKYSWNGAIQRVTEGHDSVRGNLDDGAWVIGGRVVYAVKDGVFLYAGVRHHRFSGKHTPLDAFPWQVQGDGSIAKANTRIGVGAQVMF